ncbi:hypothetical protein FB45DRAFT_876628 [Roridomyces roridus]|uniref:Uncharacterized protein n=1 Tax=Roridomyces roridus TaxID=1738132 RepID=A0AAD7B3E7_9AGAR|nr:hypothetical protein FB45DRAFT_876628 [Roridomyces roridus]
MSHHGGPSWTSASQASTSSTSTSVDSGDRFLSELFPADLEVAEYVEGRPFITELNHFACDPPSQLAPALIGTMVWPNVHGLPQIDPMWPSIQHNVIPTIVRQGRTRTASSPAPTQPTAAMSESLERPAFPIALTRPIDFEHLARNLPNHIIPPDTTIYILPTTRGSPLFNMNSGSGTHDIFSIITQLQTFVHAPLAVADFRTKLTRTAQRSVRAYFVFRSGHGGARIWRGFLKGRNLVDGPTGADLLRGHTVMWEFFRNQDQWVMHVDLPRTGN